MQVFVIANQKGGIGKTTTATALSSILSAKGRHTLLIDADRQGNSTDTFRAAIEGQATLYDLLLEKPPVPIEACIQHLPAGDIIAADPLLRKADEILTGDVEGLYRLSDALSALSGYDAVVMDTAPTINSLLHNALIAATDVIIPVTADRYALQGLSQLYETIQAVKRRQNPTMRIAGLLLVKFSRKTNLSREVQESLTRIAEQMETRLFSTSIRECVKVREAQAVRKPLLAYDAHCTAAQDYLAFVEELLQ